MKLRFISILLVLLMMILLGMHATAEANPPAALIKPDQIKMYHNNTYTGETIVVGRGRQTYL